MPCTTNISNELESRNAATERFERDALIKQGNSTIKCIIGPFQLQSLHE